MSGTSQPPAAPPIRLGIAADLVFAGAAPASYLLNCLLVYEQLIVPINAMVIDRLLTDFSALQLKRLIDAGRLQFCPEVTAHLALRREPAAFSRDAFIATLATGVVRADDRSARIVDAIDAQLLIGDFGDFADWKRMADQAVDEFESDALRTVENLHRIGGLPLLIVDAANHSEDVDRLIDLILSEEAAALRNWLAQNWQPGLDVRDAYIHADRMLPSKRSWSGWLKFGTVTGVSTLVGALLTDPVIAFGVGTLIGAADQQFGGKTVEALADPYHPSRWLSYIGTH